MIKLLILLGAFTQVLHSHDPDAVRYWAECSDGVTRELLETGPNAEHPEGLHYVGDRHFARCPARFQRRGEFCLSPKWARIVQEKCSIRATGASRATWANE